MTTKGQNYAFITPDESEDDNENLSEENKLGKRKFRRRRMIKH